MKPIYLTDAEQNVLERVLTEVEQVIEKRETKLGLEDRVVGNRFRVTVPELFHFRTIKSKVEGAKRG